MTPNERRDQTVATVEEEALARQARMIEVEESRELKRRGERKPRNRAEKRRVKSKTYQNKVEKYRKRGKK